MSKELYESTADAFSLWLKTSMHSYMHLLHKYAKEKGLSFMQINCLRFIKKHDKCSLKEMSGCFKISTPAASQLLDRLVKNGLVIRVEGSDRRVKEHSLSEAGEELFKEYFTKFDELTYSFVDSLDEKDYERVGSTLNLMSEKFKRSLNEKDN